MDYHSNQPKTTCKYIRNNFLIFIFLKEVKNFKSLDILNLNQIKDIYFSRYNIVFTTSTYVIPMILMGFCYTRMGRHLWGTPIIGEETPQLLKNYESKKKVRIIITVSEAQNTDSCVW